MARKKSKKSKVTMSKSDAIRQFRIEKPEVGPKAIAESLNEDGYAVTAQFVSTVLSNDKRKNGAQRRKSKGVITSDELLLAKQLVERLGSISAANDAIDTYAKLLT